MVGKRGRKSSEDIATDLAVAGVAEIEVFERLEAPQCLTGELLVSIGHKRAESRPLLHSPPTSVMRTNRAFAAGAQFSGFAPKTAIPARKLRFTSVANVAPKTL